MKYLHFVFWALALFVLILGDDVLAQNTNLDEIRDQVEGDLARPGVNISRLEVSSISVEEEGLRVSGSFQAYNEKDTTSPTFGYAVYSGEVQGSQGLQRPSLPSAPEGNFTLGAEEKRKINFDVLLPDFFDKKHDGVEVSLINERGFISKTIQTKVNHPESEYYLQSVAIKDRSVLLNNDQEYAFGNGITLYANEDKAILKITLHKTFIPITITPKISYFERTYFSEPALIKKYSPIVTRTDQDTEILLPVTLTQHNLRPTIYPFQVEFESVNERVGGAIAFGRLTLGGATAKVVSLGFNNKRFSDIKPQERLNTLELSIDGSLPDMVEDRRRQRIIEGEITIKLYEGEILVYEDVRETKILPTNEMVFVLKEKLRLTDFDRIDVTVVSDKGVILDQYTQEVEDSGGYLVNLLTGLLLIGILIIYMKNRKPRQIESIPLVWIAFFMVAGMFFGNPQGVEAGARDYYDNRMGCERVQNIGGGGGGAGGGGGVIPGVSGESGSGSGDAGGGGGAAAGAWFIADKWINKWEYISGFGGTFGHNVNGSLNLEPEEIADLPDVRVVEEDLMSPAEGCYAPGSTVEIHVTVSLGLCSNSSASVNDDVDELAIFQVTTGDDWYIDYNGEYEPADIVGNPFTKPCPQGNDKTFNILHGGDPDFEDMYSRKKGWTVLSQGQNTTQQGGGSVNEVKTIFLQMPNEPGEYTLGTRLTVDPTKNGGIVESKESIPIAVCDTPPDMCYLIEGLQYIDNAGVLRDASGNPDNLPSGSDPSIDEYVIQYLDHQEIESSPLSVPTPETYGVNNNFALQTVCNLCPNPLRPTLDLKTFTNRKDAWKAVTLSDLDNHENELGGAPGPNEEVNNVDKRYSEIEYQGLYTDGGVFNIENNTTNLNNAVVQNYDNGTQVKGDQERMLKGVLWRKFFETIPNYNEISEIQNEIQNLSRAALLKKREADLLLDVIHLWTDAQGNEHYSEPYGPGGLKIYTGLVPSYHIDGGPPPNHGGTVPLYREGSNPLVPYDYYGHDHAEYIENPRGIDAALRALYTSPYDTNFLIDAMIFDNEMDSYYSNTGVLIDYELEYPLGEYVYPAGTIAPPGGPGISGGGTTYGVYNFGEMLTNQAKADLVQQWLLNDYGSATFDGCFTNGECFAGNTSSICSGGSCTNCSGGSCVVTKFWVDNSFGTSAQVAAARARTFDTYYADEPIFSGAQYDFMREIWDNLIASRETALSDMHQYRRRQIDLITQIEQLPPFFESVNEQKWPLVENYRLYRERITSAHFNALNDYALDETYLSTISGILTGDFTEDQLILYKTYVKAFYDDPELAMEHLVKRIDLNESTGASRASGLNDGDTTDTHIIQLINGNNRTCVAFEDVCSDPGIQSVFLKEGDPNTVELYDINETTAAKIDADPAIAGITPRKSMSISTVTVAGICDQTVRPLCPNNPAWDYDTVSRMVYEKNTDTATGALYDATKNLCLTQCVSPAPITHSYDSTDINTTAQAVYDTSDTGTTALADWYYDSVVGTTCVQDACPTIAGQQELVGGSNPARAQDTGNPANNYYVATFTGGGSQCVNEACTGSPGVTYEGETIFWNDAGTIRTLAGEDTNFIYDSVNDTCTPQTVDVCINLDGNQDAPPGPPPGTYTAATVFGNPNYCDYCPSSLAGIQNATNDGRVHTYNTSTGLTTEEKGWYQQPGGTCTSNRCFTEPGNVELYQDLNTGVYRQVSNDDETDFVLNTQTGYCQIDVCLNVDNSLQTDTSGNMDLSVVPDGYIDNGNGTCSEIDLCSNIPGAQATTPADYLRNAGNNTCDFCAGINGRPDVAGVQHVQSGSYANSGGSPGVLSGTSMYDYVSGNTWTLNTALNTATCEPLICTNLSGGMGFEDVGGGVIEYNGSITDLELTSGSSCGCSENGIIPGQESCYVCNASTNYLNESDGSEGCPAAPNRACQLLPGPGTITITASQYNQFDGTEFVHSDSRTYRISTLGSGDRACTETETPTFELTTTTGFIDVGEACTINLNAVNVDQCRITLLDSNFVISNNCQSGDGTSGDKCIIATNPLTKIVNFTQELEMDTASGSVLVVAECAPTPVGNMSGVLEGEYTLETEAECRISPNIGEF